MTHYDLPDTCRRAASIRIGVCPDGHAHVTLLDSAGTAFADACLGKKYAYETARDLFSAAEQLPAEKRK